ncbi:2-dehydropantoate 2-reductase [Schizophyllum commune H4-8]|uniref:2-dehydropantoate 2-reductase n=1 Tax=Schizophyllum commune (strain H4-8 / FGSC 9210) TaxID=578458 RepID=D8PRC6_SCHCM|nr:2-dehydropantoate 2-reductase [Schizophyllum commune H4-8]KAI5898005.1 2-dehydropantoate 2-reductase [Schizophyllum commune H4-8]
MRFHVVGLGPIGTLAAFHLRRAVPRSTPISLIHRKQQQPQREENVLKVERDGVVSTEDGFDVEYFPGSQTDTSMEATNPLTDIHSLIIATKAQATFGVVEALLPNLSRNSTIVLLQNGMGVYERLVETIFKNPANRPHFICTVNTHGATMREARRHAIHRGLGALRFGIMPNINRDFEKSLRNPELPPEERVLSLSDISSEGDPQAERYQSLLMTVAALSVMDLNPQWTPIETLQIAMYQKLVANAIINPLTALLRCPNGELLAHNATKNIALKVCTEAGTTFHKMYASRLDKEMRMMHAQGLAPRTQPQVPRELWSSSLMEETMRIAEVTAKNTSSMLYDVLHARPTEVDFINGHICRLGKQYSVATPTTKTLWDLMQLRAAIPLDLIV